MRCSIFIHTSLCHIHLLKCVSWNLHHMIQYVGLQYANMYNLAGATVYVIVNSTFLYWDIVVVSLNPRRSFLDERTVSHNATVSGWSQWARLKLYTNFSRHSEGHLTTLCLRYGILAAFELLSRTSSRSTNTSNALANEQANGFHCHTWCD